MFALDGQARRREPRKLRLRLFSAVGRLARGGRRLRLKISSGWPWATQITAAITRIDALRARLTGPSHPDDQERKTNAGTWNPPGRPG